MVLTIILGALTLLSLVLLFWQLIAALRFPLHRRIDDRSLAEGRAGCPQPAAALPDSARRAEGSAPYRQAHAATWMIHLFRNNSLWTSSWMSERTP